MHEHHALVPRADGDAVLVSRGRLPSVRTESRELPAVLSALAAAGLRSSYLRLVRRLVEEGAATTLLALDAPAPGWPPPEGTEWLCLRDADAQRLAPAVLADGVARWLEEQRGAPVPSQRNAWERPGWEADPVRWVVGQVDVLREPEVVRQWPLSSVLRFETPDGPVFLKAVFPLFHHEPAVTAALAREHGGVVPEVVAIDAERGWLLMRELRGDLVFGCDRRWWAEQLRVVARMQRAWVGRADELRALGAPSRPLEELAAEEPAVEPLCARLAAFPVSETLVHGDLHPWNAVVDGERVVVFDWSDAAVAHPFLDLAPFLQRADEADRDALVAAYLEPWADVADAAALREAAAVGEALGCVYQVLTYRAIVAALEPDSRGAFGMGAAEGEWRERAAALAAALAERL